MWGLPDDASLLSSGVIDSSGNLSGATLRSGARAPLRSLLLAGAHDSSDGASSSPSDGRSMALLSMASVPWSPPGLLRPRALQPRLDGMNAVQLSPRSTAEPSRRARSSGGAQRVLTPYGKSLAQAGRLPQQQQLLARSTGA